MHIKRLDVEIPDKFFVVKDDFLYYAQKKCDCKGIRLIGDELYLYHYFLGENKQHLRKLQFNASNRTVDTTTEIEIEGQFQNWDFSFHRSRFIHTNRNFTQLLCLANQQLYNVPGLSTNNPIFTHNDRLYFVTYQKMTWILNSFALDDKSQAMKSEELTGSDDLTMIFYYGNAVVSCVFDDVVYFVKNAEFPKIIKLNLNSNTLTEVSTAINFNVRSVNYDSKAIYALDYDKQSEKFKGFYKMSVKEENADPLKCPRCDNLFYIPKIVKGCGHSICYSCENGMLKPFLDANNTKLNCPVRWCQNVAVVNKGEELLINQALKDIIDKGEMMKIDEEFDGSKRKRIRLGINIKTEKESATNIKTVTCLSCLESDLPHRALKCIDCIAENRLPKDHTICSNCTATKHPGHSFKYAFVHDSTKAAFIEKFACGDEEFKRKAFEFLRKQLLQFKQLNTSFNAFKALKNRMEATNIPTDQWESECAEMEKLYEVAMQKKRALDDDQNEPSKP